MIKKALLVICLMIAPSSAIANVFSDALSFVCGGGTVTETWNGQTRSPDKTPYCPPYNKFGNRGGCLKQYSAPQLGTLIYMQYCAEEAPSSSYFNPKIQVRMQSCNPLACWALSSELNWDGECVLWPTPLLFPLQRLCARMAAPADNTATPATPADDGYTYFKHLNFEGAVVDDPRIPGTDGQSTFIVSPKTCAYWDPWAFDLFPVMPISYIPFFDIFDYNPIKQPFHKNAGVHPIVQMMISLLEAGLNSSQMILRLMVYIQEASMGPIGMLVELIGDKTGLTKMIIDMVSSCIKIVGEEVFVRILKEFGQLNHVVYDSKIGCVPVPMGPFPPPYPKQYASAPPAPTIEPVCASTAGYAVTVTSTASNFVPSATVIAPAPPVPPTGATLITNNGVTDTSGNTTYGFTVRNQDGSTTTTTSVTPAFIASSGTKKCATSTKSNNIINNVVRVGVDRILPRCDLASLSNLNNPTANTSTTTVAANSCVNITDINGSVSGTLSAKAIALNPAGILSCKNGSAPCIKVTTPAVCAPTVCGGADSSTTSSTCPAALAASADCPATSCGYRPIYATQYVAGATPLSNPYYDPTLPDCNGLAYPCQVVWGVNAGPYTDLVVPFPTTESSSTENTQTLVNMNPAVSSPPPATLCYNGQSYSFRAAVSRVADTPVTLSYATTANTAGSYSNAAAAGTGISPQDPTKICIYTATDPSISQSGSAGGTPPIWTLDTCLPRAPVPTPTVLSCGSPNTVSCTTSNFAPAMVVKLAVGSYSTQGVLAANAFAANTSYTTTLNLAGYEYGASVTDNTFITPDKFPTIPNTTTHNPAWACGNTSNFAASFTASDYNTSSFPTPPQANNGTYFGTSGTSTFTSTYLPARSGTHPNGSNPNEQNCVGATIPYYITTNTAAPMVQTGAIYRKGLVYVNNKYLVGGNYMCLNTLTQNTCATDTSNCVLAALQNSTFFDCSTFNTKVLGVYPDISYCGNAVDPTCQFLSTISSPNNNSVTVYQCGSTTTTPPVNPYKCYSYSSSTTTGALCTVSSDPAMRITPAAPNPIGSNPRLTANQYYDPNTNQGSAQSTITNAGTNTPPVVQDCGSYLNRVVDINDPTSNPYVGISQCAVIDSSTAGNATPLCTGSTSIVGTPPNPMSPGMCYNSNLQLPVCSTSAPIIESFTSTLSTSPALAMKLDVHNCYSSHTNPITKVVTGQNNYCYSATYTPASTPDACQINTSTVSRLTTGGNPAVGSSTLNCSTFITLFGNSNPVSLISNSPYANIAACPSTPPGSVTTTLTDASNSNFAVDIYQYATIVASTSTLPVLAPPVSQLNYCYNPRTAGGSTCTLNRTNTEASRPSAIDCRTLLTLINSNYQSIISCAAPPVTCASQATVDSYATQNYANTGRCTNPSPPTCTVEATASSATTGKIVTVKKCSYDTDITLNYANGESNTTTTAQNYYCYSYNGDSAPSPSCSLAPTNVAITPVSNPAPSTMSTELPTLSIPSVITDINGAGATPPPGNQLPVEPRGIRSKTMLEQGLCADVPALPNCAAVTPATSSSGYATWPSVAPGIQSQGSCMTGYIPISTTSLQRYCLISPENASPGVAPAPSFEPIAGLGCKPPVCPAVTTLSANDGYALWKGPNSDGSTPLNQKATGVCANGYTPPASGDLTMRTCELNGAVANLSPVDATNTCIVLPWNVRFIYPDTANGVWTTTSSATPTFYASDFVSRSQTIGNFISNTNNYWGNINNLCNNCVYTNVSGNKTAIFVPGPKMPSNASASNVVTLYLNIPDISKIAKIAFIDNACSWNNDNNCLSTSTNFNNPQADFALSTGSVSTSNPIVIDANNYQGSPGNYAKVQFDGTVSLTVNGISNSGSLGWGPNKWFGWKSGHPGGHDGWMLYTTTPIDGNVGVTNALRSGINTIQIRFSTSLGGLYMNGLGFWYIELLP